MHVALVGMKLRLRVRKSFSLADLSYFRLFFHAHWSTGLASLRTEERISSEFLSWRSEPCNVEWVPITELAEG